MTWELTAPMAKVLLTGKVRRSDLLPLAYKELVLREALTTGERKRRFVTTSTLTPTDTAVDLPPELDVLWRDVREHLTEGGSTQKVISTMAGSSDAHRHYDRLVRDLAVSRSLITLEPRKVLGLRAGHRVVLTSSGVEQRDRLRAMLAVARDHLLLPAVLLLSEPGRFPEIDRALESFDGAFVGIDSACGGDGDGADGGGDGGGGD